MTQYTDADVTDAADIETNTDWWIAREHVGEVTIFTNIVPTTVPAIGGEGTDNAARATITALTATPTTWHDNLVYGNLAKTLRNATTSAVIGIVAKGEAKPGMSPPFILNGVPATQRTAAITWLNNNTATASPDDAPF